jgi:hypothetical protein
MAEQPCPGLPARWLVGLEAQGQLRLGLQGVLRWLWGAGNDLWADDERGGACDSTFMRPFRASRRSSFVLAFAVGCSSEEPAAPAVPSVFDPKIERIVLEVDYAEGAAPYTGPAAAMSDVWVLFEDNARALFPTETLVVPHSLSEMESIGQLAPASFDAAAILDLATLHRDSVDGGDTATFYAIWLDGIYEDASGTRPEVLGVSLGNSGVIAMFKPTIESAGLGPLDAVSRYVEQATLVHEFGHAVGLVNNGLPLTSDHHDEEHGAHCDVESCVMYYTIEGVGGAIDFVQQYLVSGDTILFGPACLADAAAAR